MRALAWTLSAASELGWLIAFILLVPVAVLAVGLPAALVVRLVLRLFHLE